MKDLANQGKLGITVTATFYAKARARGNATTTVYAYLIVNGKESLACQATAKGGGYSSLDIANLYPQDGSWATDQKTITVSSAITSSDFTIGYRYCLITDKQNSLVFNAYDFGCVELSCSFYVI